MEEYSITSLALMDKGFCDLNPLTVGRHRCPPLHTAYGSRPYHLIHYVERGEGTLKIEGKRYRIARGEIFIIPKGAEAEYVADEQRPWEYVWIGFTGRLAERLYGLPPVMEASAAPYHRLKGLLSNGTSREEMAASALFMVFAEIFSKEKVRPDYVKQTTDAINSLYMTGLRVSELAESVGLDRRYLCRIFHAAMGMSIKEYVTKVRMEHARRLLSEGVSVGHTSELVGYNDPFNFAKMFKKYFGSSPGMWIADARRDAEPTDA